MKPFELTLWLATALLLFRHMIGGTRASLGTSLVIAGLAVALIALQLFFEGWRSPIVPAIGALLLLSISPLLRSLLRFPDDGFVARLALCGATLLLAASTAATWLRPAVNYPRPGGPYPVIGVAALPVVGESPPGDVPTLDELRHPPPLVKLWYPAQSVQPPGLFDPRRLSELRRRFGERGRSFDEPAIIGAPPLDLPERAPILFYYPGWPGTTIESTALVRELVSHGYYVATVEYPARQSGMSAARWQALKAELERSYYYGSEALYREMVEISVTRIRSRSRDASAALDRLTQLASAAGNPLAGRYDPGRAGIIGFSLGGGIAIQTANQDPRFVTAVNLDGRTWAEGRTEGAKGPTLMISEPLIIPDQSMLNSPDSDIRYNAIEDTDDYAMLDANLARHGGMHVTINGMQHFNFSDFCLSSPVRKLTGSGPIDPLRGYAITYAYVLAWFDRALQGKASPLLDTTASPFPETIVQYWPTPQPAAGLAGQP